MPTLDLATWESWVFLGPIIILVSLILYGLVKTGAQFIKSLKDNLSEAELGPLKFKTKENSHEDHEDIDVKGMLEDLQSQVLGLQKQARISEAKLYLIDKVKKDKIEFRQKVRKFADLLEGDIQTGFEDFLVGCEIDEDLIPRLDDFRVFVSKLSTLKDKIIGKALTDWDLNGFHKMGADDSKSTLDNAKDVRDYIDNQIKSYKLLIKQILLNGSDVEPMIIYDGKPVPKPLVVSPSDITNVYRPHFPYVEEEIKDLYTSAISWAKVRQEKYLNIESGEND